MSETLTIVETLEQALGTELSSSEATELLAKAELLCELDASVLEAIWQDLSESQLGFQDYVFNTHCSERSQAYIEATGRLAPVATP